MMTVKFNGWEPGNSDDGKNHAGTHFLATLPYTFGCYLEDLTLAESSLQLDVERRLKSMLEASVPELPPILCGHDGSTMPEQGDFMLIVADFPRTETEGYPDVPVRFQVMTDVAIESTRVSQVDVHSQRVGKIIDRFNWQNFDETMQLLNS